MGWNCTFCGGPIRKNARHYQSEDGSERAHIKCYEQENPSPGSRARAPKYDDLVEENDALKIIIERMHEEEIPHPWRR